MKVILGLAFLLVASSALAGNTKVYSMIGGVPVNKMCQDKNGDFKATISSCTDYTVNEAGPQCYGPTKEVVKISQYQTVCDSYSTGEDYPACTSSHVERVSLTSSVDVIETDISYTVNEAGPTNAARVVGREVFTIPQCKN